MLSCPVKTNLQTVVYKMNAIKQIILIILFMTNLMETIYSGGRTKRQKECAVKIYNKFGYDATKRYQYRNVIPKLAFRHKLYYMLADDGEDISVAQKYFVHIYDLIRAKDDTLDPSLWCTQFSGAKICYEEMQQFFPDLVDPTEIMKYAYLNLVEDSFRSKEAGVKSLAYFRYLIQNLDVIDGAEFMTPLEFCQGKSKATPQHNKGKKRDKSDNGFGTKPPKTHRKSTVGCSADYN